MNIQIGSGQINGALFNIGDCFAIIIMIPVFETAIFPLITKMKGSVISRTQKLVSGMVIAAVGVLTAAALEYARRAAPVLDVISDCAPPGIYMSDLSGFLMFIPFFLIGTGEVLINPCIYYFVYDQAPPRTRSLTQVCVHLPGVLSPQHNRLKTLYLLSYPFLQRRPSTCLHLAPSRTASRPRSRRRCKSTTPITSTTGTSSTFTTSAPLPLLLPSRCIYSLPPFLRRRTTRT